MSKQYKLAVVGLFISLSAMLVQKSFAGDNNNQPGSSGPAASARAISLDEFRERCAHPDQFDVQKAPQNIRIQCGVSEHEYVTSTSGEVPLPDTRHVTTALVADKFFVNATAQDVAVAGKGGSCLRFKEVEKDLTIEKPLSCDDLLNMKGDLSDYCSSAIDLAKGSNPKLVQTKDTGKVIDTCNVAQ
jgi:hypothetical protein